MRRAVLLASVAAMVAALLAGAAVTGQEPESGVAFVAFRVDGTHAIATLKVMGTSEKQVTEGLSAEPMARFGYRYFDPPAPLREEGPADMRAGDRWVIHTAPGRAFQAETERIVGGNAGCQDALGVLLRVAPEQSDAFAALPTKYFLAERTTVRQPLKAESMSIVGVTASPSTSEFRRVLESTLNALLARELPGVRVTAAPHLSRMTASPVAAHRSWARQQQAVEKAMQSGRGELTYDIQSVRLAPDGAPLHFVRAEWAVRQRQGFVASLWLRGERPVDVVNANLRPASWLRMFEFQGRVAREHPGLILNVFDSDHDGWGEVLMAQGGYESMSISLLEYSPTGFRSTGSEYSYGC